MKSFSAFIASTAAAYGTNGGPLQGHGPSPTIGGRFGYGYNVGNDYTAGDSHGHEMGVPEFNIQSAHDHIIGYDSVQPQTDAIWTANSANMSALVVTLLPILANINTARATYLTQRMNLKISRLDEIHDDNLVKVDAPFTLQLDLLENELQDLERAKLHATTDSTSAWDDLKTRMDDYRTDRIRDLNMEAARVMRVLDRAVTDSKPVEDVFYAMRLDWLQGVYINNGAAINDPDVYDMSYFDSEFDLFTYDIGSGKGHGHTNQGNVGPRTDAGFVVGNGEGVRDMNGPLRAAPGPVDGKTRRYDRQTLSGGRNDYGLGVAQGRKGGAFGYDQAAQEQVGLRRRGGGTSR